MENAPTPLIPQTPGAREERMEATLQQLKGYFCSLLKSDKRAEKWTRIINKALADDFMKKEEPSELVNSPPQKSPAVNPSITVWVSTPQGKRCAYVVPADYMLELLTWLEQRQIQL